MTRKIILPKTVAEVAEVEDVEVEQVEQVAEVEQNARSHALDVLSPDIYLHILKIYINTICYIHIRIQQTKSIPLST